MYYKFILNFGILSCHLDYLGVLYDTTKIVLNMVVTFLKRIFIAHGHESYAFTWLNHRTYRNDVCLSIRINCMVHLKS